MSKTKDAKKYWLMKSEPEVFSIDDLRRKKIALWDGVRNYQARNFMMKEMKVGDEILFYHSSSTPPGVTGLARVVSAAEPDPTQFNAQSEYFETKATPDKPRWFAVRVEFVEKFPRLVALDELRREKKLAAMLVLKPGQRLSIQPVKEQEFNWICALVKKPTS